MERVRCLPIVGQVVLKVYTDSLSNILELKLVKVTKVVRVNDKLVEEAHTLQNVCKISRSLILESLKEMRQDHAL